MQHSSTSQQWNAALYDNQHAFVWQRAADLLDKLAPQPGERILDVGCGTGHLTQEIASRAAQVIGLDLSPQMIERARALFPTLDVRVADATDFAFDEPFDAVFSNATLHWVRPPEAAVHCISRALKLGGRLVCEFGGKGNVEHLLTAVESGLRCVGQENFDVRTNYFPSIGEYATLLESTGFEVAWAAHFDRPTPLEGDDGLRRWVEQFREPAVRAVPAGREDEFWQAVEISAREDLFHDNQWFADYRRLRLCAIKVL